VRAVSDGNRTVVVGQRFLTPVEFGDVFAIFGSDPKSHVVALTDAADLQRGVARTVEARCGRKGRKVRIQAQHQLPKNIVERHAVCQDCREFTLGTDG
jgi:hypothetical protein